MFLIRAGKVKHRQGISDSETHPGDARPASSSEEMALLRSCRGAPAPPWGGRATDRRIEQAAFRTLVRKSGRSRCACCAGCPRACEAGRQIQSLIEPLRGGARAHPPCARWPRAPDAGGVALAARGTTGRSSPPAPASKRTRRTAWRGLPARRLLVLRGDRLRRPEKLLTSSSSIVDLQERYDPLDVSELAELTRPGRAGGHAIVKRVLRRRHRGGARRDRTATPPTSRSSSDSSTPEERRTDASCPVCPRALGHWIARAVAPQAVLESLLERG